LKERVIDAQVSPAWASLHLIVILLISFFIFMLLQLSVAAREAQQEKLRDAHEQLRRSNKRLATSTRLIRRYVPTQLAEKILAGEHTEGRRPERRKLTLFFSDVVDFTPAADQMEPEDLSELLNEYLAEMTTIADAAGATVNQFVGDGIMIFFGAPEATNDRDHALRTVQMAQAMQRRMSDLGRKWFEEGIQTPFRIRIGINTGLASVGDFGSEGRMTYSAIGNQTNLTARIQDHCTPGRILISHTTWALIREDIPCEPRGEIELKGLHYPVRVYEVAETMSPAAS
jgi:class 3 adenylate cyclase